MPYGDVSVTHGPSKAETVTIAAAGSLSSAIDCRGQVAMAILMPAAWTAAGIAFQVCDTVDGTYRKLYYDASGTKTRVQVVEGGAVAAGEAYQIPEAAYISGGFLKLESINAGTLAAEVQAAERSIVALLG